MAIVMLNMCEYLKIFLHAHRVRMTLRLTTFDIYSQEYFPQIDIILRVTFTLKAVRTTNKPTLENFKKFSQIYPETTSISCHTEVL